MDPDKYQQAWQTHSSQTRVSINADLLLKEVQRHQRSFQDVIFWRDIREVGGSLIMLPIWFYLGNKFDVPWSFYLTVPALLWVAGFMLVDRMRNRPKPNPAGDTLIESVKRSIAQVEHQIWLLRNVFWWYLLPFCISIMAFFAHVAWMSASAWWEFLAFTGFLGLFLFVIYGWVYFLNQSAVRNDLEPRYRELSKLLASLSDEASGGATDSYDIVPASVSPFATGTRATSCGTGVRSVLTMLGLLGMIILVIVTVDQLGRRADTSYDGPPQSRGQSGDALADTITNLREEKKVVGLAAMVMIDGKVEAAAAHGERKVGSGIAVEIDDRWHLGGIAKSMTATMIARLVESGQMQWTDTLGEVFPAATMHADWNAVTLKQLLTDTAGAPPSFTLDVRRRRPAFGPDCKEVRREVVLDIIADEPTYPPGSKNEYSNVGVVIASAMAEEVTGTSWKELMEQEVFIPLEFTGAGFGPPKSSDSTLEQPRGHRARLAGKIAADDDDDNTPIMGPSAAIHMTLRDLCVFANEHMLGERGEGTLLSAETYKLLHTPVRNQYAFGWIPWGPGGRFPYVGGTIPDRLYWHNGSNTLWYALVVFVPEKNMVIAVTSNDGDDLAEAATWKIVKDILNPSPDDTNSETFAKKSPFKAVRWSESQAEVKLDDEWFTLVSLDDLPVESILAFSRETYGVIWRKRFEEDLVELLTRMGHPPEDEVTLVVRSLATSEVLTRENVPMTKANRRAIWDAANGF